MAFSIDELTKKAKDMANLAADKTKDAAELVKINVAIAGEQKEIEKNYRVIGEWFVNEYEGEIPDAVREMVEAVNASKAKIAELEAGKPAKEEAPEAAPRPARRPAPSAARCPTANSAPSAALPWENKRICPKQRVSFRHTLFFPAADFLLKCCICHIICASKTVCCKKLANS